MVDFEYHDGSARAAVNQFDQLSEDVRALTDGLAGELSGDSPWSQDKIGSAFGSRFDPQRSSAIGNAQDFAQRLQSFAPTISDAATAVTEADQTGSA